MARYLRSFFRPRSTMADGPGCLAPWICIEHNKFFMRAFDELDIELRSICFRFLSSKLWVSQEQSQEMTCTLLLSYICGPSMHKTEVVDKLDVFICQHHD